MLWGMAGTGASQRRLACGADPAPPQPPPQPPLRSLGSRSLDPSHLHGPATMHLHQVLLYVYPFGFWKLYSSLLKQRKQRLGSTEAKAKAA